MEDDFNGTERRDDICVVTDPDELPEDAERVSFEGMLKDKATGRLSDAMRHTASVYYERDDPDEVDQHYQEAKSYLKEAEELHNEVKE